MKSNFFKSLVVALIFVTVGCGSTDSPSGTTSGDKPSTDNCTFAAPAAGKKVLFIGTQGSSSANFTNVDRDYIGNVVTVFNNNSAQVEWSALAKSTVEFFAVLAPEGTCSPDITGKRAVFTGTRGSSSADFTNVDASYVGKVISVFAGGRAEVDWDHLSYNTAESFNVIALEQ